MYSASLIFHLKSLLYYQLYYTILYYTTKTAEEKYALSFGLDHQIPCTSNKNMIKTEFEGFYYHIHEHLFHLSSDEVDILKSKIRRSCENYSNIALVKKKNGVIDTLIKNKNIVVIMQDKGCGVVLMDKSKYIEKCLQHVDTQNFVKQPTDNTKTIENKVQRMLLKIKRKEIKYTDDSLYPSGSNPGRFYGTVKVHKLEPRDRTNIKKLTIRPIISNNGMATYETATYETAR